MYMSVGCGRKPTQTLENNLHTERLQSTARFKPGNFLLLGNNANHCTKLTLYSIHYTAWSFLILEWVAFFTLTSEGFTDASHIFTELACEGLAVHTHTHVFKHRHTWHSQPQTHPHACQNGWCTSNLCIYLSSRAANSDVRLTPASNMCLFHTQGLFHYKRLSFLSGEF